MAIRNKERVELQKSKQEAGPRRLLPSRDVARKSTKSQNFLIRYFQDTGEEMRKVTWPSRDQAIRLTLIVLGTTVAAAIFLGLLDFLFHQLAALLI